MPIPMTPSTKNPWNKVTKRQVIRGLLDECQGKTTIAGLVNLAHRKGFSVSKYHVADTVTAWLAEHPEFAANFMYMKAPRSKKSAATNVDREKWEKATLKIFGVDRGYEIIKKF